MDRLFFCNGMGERDGGELEKVFEINEEKELAALTLWKGIPIIVL